MKPRCFPPRVLALCFVFSRPTLLRPKHPRNLTFGRPRTSLHSPHPLVSPAIPLLYGSPRAQGLHLSIPLPSLSVDFYHLELEDFFTWMQPKKALRRVSSRHDGEPYMSFATLSEWSIACIRTANVPILHAGNQSHNFLLSNFIFRFSTIAYAYIAKEKQ
ncbi:hypothetical protein B0J12DRAFT_668567 [Macrophomina phaseolina]|uniref:Uncharacterized protein n=1 Tax=Macrophomina phaseolina TaxID=35725 RepID=A0ABQ8G7P8_9PEZI|nr:hypothetical protein B0J12DRAFT_668567 [Macrophomina phaseolina]